MRSVKALFVMALVILLLVGTGIILKLRAGADATGTDRSASAPTPAAARGSPASTSPAETAVEAEASIGPSGVATNYELKNAADAGAEWSSNKTHVPPKTNRTYLGDYGPGQPLTLTLNRLPRHELIRITFDLYLTRSWDGSSPIWGNCLWLAELNGRKLIASTFGNCGFFSDNDEQSFPDPYPCRPHPAWTGATEHETLGVMQDWGGPERTFDCSSVYHMVLVAPHTGSDAVFDFSSKFEKPGRKYWGIANVKVETIASIKKLSDDDLKTLWATFSGPDAVAAFHAGWDLASAGDGAVDYIRAHLADAPPPQTDPIDRLLVDLQDDQKRFVIMEKVRYRGEEIIPMLQAAQPTLPQGQVQYRVSTLLDQLKRYPDSPTETRARRVRHLLEIIGTPAAQMLANDIPDPDAGG